MGVARARRVKRSKAQWSEILRRFRLSGLSATAFCRREGLPSSSLLRWRQRIDPVPAPPFVELVPAGAKAHARSVTAEPATGWLVELELPNGLSIRVRA